MEACEGLVIRSDTQGVGHEGQSPAFRTKSILRAQIGSSDNITHLLFGSTVIKYIYTVKFSIVIIFRCTLERR